MAQAASATASARAQATHSQIRAASVAHGEKPWRPEERTDTGPKLISVEAQAGNQRTLNFYVSVHNHDLPKIPAKDISFNDVWDAHAIRWAADETLWLAWYCTSPTFDGLFASLHYKKSHIPVESRTETDSGGPQSVNFYMRADVARQWNTIADVLQRLDRLLTAHRIDVRGTLPPLEMSYVPRWDQQRLFRPYPSRPKALNSFMRAKQTLIVWMSLVSFHMALRPDVLDILVRNFDGDWLTTIQGSWMMDPEAPRVGAFVDATTTYAQWMSLLPHMHHYPGMPIWLFYGSKGLENYAHPMFKTYLPLERDVLLALQNAGKATSSATPIPPSSALSIIPSTTTSTPSSSREPGASQQPSLPRVIDPDAPVPSVDSRQKQGQTPEQFFEEQRIARIARMAKETEAQRVFREKREAEQNALAQPTRKGPSVWVWEEEVHNDKVYWMRKYCGAKRRQELWQETSPQMRVYHSIIDEWDVWSGLDPNWSNDEDDWFPGADGLADIPQWKPPQESSGDRTPPTPDLLEGSSGIQPAQALHTRTPPLRLTPPRPMGRRQDLQVARSASDLRGRERSPARGRLRSPQSRSASPARRPREQSYRQPRSPSRVSSSASRPNPSAQPYDSLLLTREEMQELSQNQWGEGRPVPVRITVDNILKVFQYRYGLRFDPGYRPSQPSSDYKIKKDSDLWRVWSFHGGKDPLPAEWVPYVVDLTSRLLCKAQIPAELSSLGVSLSRTLPSREHAALQPVSRLEAGDPPQGQSAPRTVYMAMGSGASDFPWILTIPSAATAAEISRRGWGPSKQDLVLELVHRGIPFAILLEMQGEPSSDRKAATKASSGGLGWRLAPFKASHFDYALYEQYCGSFLRQRRYARVGLVQGGIIWRLCIQYLDPEAILAGPVLDPGHQRVVTMQDRAYVEDVLSQGEQDLICGVYKILNGPTGGKSYHWQPSDSTTAKDYSWWPKQSTWEESGAHVGHWSSANEEWFQARLERIRENRAEPCSATQWREALKYQKSATKPLLRRIEELCQDSL